MSLLLCVTAALAAPETLRVYLGTDVGLSRIDNGHVGQRFALERQVLPRWSLGVGTRFRGRTADQVLQPFRAPDYAYTHGQRYTELSSGWATARWQAAGTERGATSLLLDLHAGLGARRLYAEDPSKLDPRVDYVYPIQSAFSSQGLAQAGLSLSAFRNHWGLQTSATGTLSTLPEHLRGEVSPLTLWTGLAVVFRI